MYRIKEWKHGNDKRYEVQCRFLFIWYNPLECSYDLGLFDDYYKAKEALNHLKTKRTSRIVCIDNA